MLPIIFSLAIVMFPLSTQTLCAKLLFPKLIFLLIILELLDILDYGRHRLTISMLQKFKEFIMVDV